jgi:hypothetical protein
MQFESHLGHSVFAGQGLFRVLLLTKLDFSRWVLRLRAIEGLGTPSSFDLSDDKVAIPVAWRSSFAWR